ncbi:unnamed protein product [Lampetra fluviatilis]
MRDVALETASTVFGKEPRREVVSRCGAHAIPWGVEVPYPLSPSNNEDNEKKRKEEEIGGEAAEVDGGLGVVAAGRSSSDHTSPRWVPSSQRRNPSAFSAPRLPAAARVAKRQDANEDVPAESRSHRLGKEKLGVPHPLIVPPERRSGRQRHLIGVRDETAPRT